MGPDPLPDPTGARSALDTADRAGASLARGGSWFRLYLALFAVASVAMVLAVGLGGPVGMVAGLGLWSVTIAFAVPWAARQGVVPRGVQARNAWTWGTWTVLYAAALLVGLLAFPGQPSFWVPAALVTAVPFLVTAGTQPRSAATTARAGT